jgi:hypothetical protein
MSKVIHELSIKALLSEGVNYVIPMYQRNYAWDEAEISQLIQDVIDYLPREQRYYIGTLVVFERPHAGRTVYETIDGQQRLTTLSLLVSYLKNKRAADLSWYSELSIRFESRERSQKTFAAVFDGRFDKDPSELLAPKDTNSAILNGYRLVDKLLWRKLQDNAVSEHDFIGYLLEKVILMRVKVPPETDLNHYFEVMNSRGEQLEKHEVLKALMMEVLEDIPDPAESEESQQCLHAVWEACANMERYVQMGFTPAQRDRLFQPKNWSQWQASDFAQLREALNFPAKDASTTSNAPTLEDIIKGPAAPSAKDETRDDSPERFHSVINFPNFLLHVLRVMTGEDIPLDDKRLVSTFREHVLRGPERIEKVKAFVVALLRCKYLFDQYVIKREYNKGADGWSLKRLKWYESDEKNSPGKPGYANTFGEDSDEGENKRILMLLAAFHVSTPTLVYKHWLNAALNYLFHAQEVRAESYRDYLESVARAFVFDNFLAHEGKAKYFDIIYRNDGKCRARPSSIDDDALRLRLSYDHIENNLVFNYLDYLLWLKLRQGKKEINDFEFTFRSSVEHFYPRNPMNGAPQLADGILNSFGNLCLISHSKNSRLSNYSPTAKVEQSRNSGIDSIKQYLMMEMMDSGAWDATRIEDHYQEMRQILVGSLENVTEYCL